MQYLYNVSTLTYSPELCTGCRRCVEVCPHAVFSMENKKARLDERDACMECGACMRNCDSGAIYVNAGVGCSAALISSLLTGKEASCGCDSGSSTTSCC